MLHIKVMEKSEEQHAIKISDLMHTLTSGLGKKARRWNCTGKYILIELSMLSLTLKHWLYLTYFCYDLSEIQDGLKCWRNGINIFW